MFRSTAIQTLRRAHQFSCNNTNRSLVTAAQKRALNNDQIAGTEVSSKAADVKPPTSSSGASESTGSSSSSDGGGGGGGGALFPIVGGIAAAAGVGYYMDLIPKDLIPMGKAEEQDVKKDETKEAAVEIKDDVNEEEATTVVEKKEVEKSKSEESASTTSSESTGNRVINIQAPSTSGRTSDPLPTIEHDPSGSRVSIEKFGNVYGSSSSKSTEKEATTVVETATTATSKDNDVPSLKSIAAAESELTPVTSSKIDDALTQAHVAMRATLDNTFLKDLDKLSENELRVRIAQLATEMGERTKWEAVRLREFLSMKEKEVADK